MNFDKHLCIIDSSSNLLYKIIKLIQQFMEYPAPYVDSWNNVMCYQLVFGRDRPECNFSSDISLME